MSEPLKQHGAREETENPVALAVSAIIFHKTSNPPKILFCYSGKQNRYILPGGHFYKKVEGTNEKKPAWEVNPDLDLVDFLLEEKLKKKYGIHAKLDGGFHKERKMIGNRDGIAFIEPHPFLILSEKPIFEDGHVWHHDYYYICEKVFPDDSGIAEPCKWYSLQEVQQLVENKNIFANLTEVFENAVAAKKAITDKRGEEV